MSLALWISDLHSDQAAQKPKDFANEYGAIMTLVTFLASSEISLIRSTPVRGQLYVQGMHGAPGASGRWRVHISGKVAALAAGLRGHMQQRRQVAGAFLLRTESHTLNRVSRRPKRSLEEGMS